ncbi:MAG: phosphatase PAP2 family protein [Anaerolineae bacterium]|nr:phosphatase PAP2 family protein [Anaerolineae bacterium]
MEMILNWGIEVILWLQQFHPSLDAAFEFITLAGNEKFFLLLLPLLYWCLDRRTGVRMFVLCLLTLYINEAAKVFFDQPRPAELNARVWCYTDDPAEGRFPSGHTQITTVTWGYLATQLRRRWLWILAVVMMALVPLSRLYLGIHFPHDLLGGYLIGLIILLAFIWLIPDVERWLDARKLSEQLIVAIAVPILMALLLPTESAVTACATLTGAGIGAVFERHWLRFGVQGGWQRRSLRYVTGLAILVGIWLGLRFAFASLEPAMPFRYLRYGLAGLWATFGAPWFFLKLGMASKDKE